MVIKPASDFSRPASELNANTGTVSGGALPNTNNKPALTAVQTTVADASIKNFLQGINWPPTTAGDRDKMKAAILAYKAKIKGTKQAAAKKAGQNATPVKLLETAATDKVGTTVPDIAKYLPVGTDLAKVSYDTAIKAMEITVSQMETLIKSPVSAGSSASNTRPPGDIMNYEKF